MHGENSRLPTLVDRRLVKALDHPVRQHILLAAVQHEVSPKMLSELLKESLGTVSYHCGVLRKECGEIIKETRTEPRRGAIEHYYRASAKTLLPAKTWRRAKEGLRAVIGAGLASDLFNDLIAALEAGKLQGKYDQIMRTPLVLDAQGQRNVKAIVDWAATEVEKEQQAASRRMVEANGNGEKVAGHIFAAMAFEAAWEPADLSAFARKSATRKSRGNKRGGRKAGG